MLNILMMNFTRINITFHSHSYDQFNLRKCLFYFWCSLPVQNICSSNFLSLVAINNFNPLSVTDSLFFVIYLHQFVHQVTCCFALTLQPLICPLRVKLYMFSFLLIGQSNISIIILSKSLLFFYFLQNFPIVNVLHLRYYQCAY